jgi:predicted nucleic acid-binding protein
MITLTTADIERQIVNFTLEFDSLKDDEIEWRYQPPPFVVAFMQYIDERLCLPSPEDFHEYYIHLNRTALQEYFDQWHDAPTRNWKKRALMARLHRAYPSFVRDVYLCALLRENGIHANYDATQDVEAGVDLVVTYNARQFQLHVFLDTARAQQGRAKKNRRHSFAGVHIDLALKPNECKRVGAFWLPTQKHVEEIKQRMSG